MPELPEVETVRRQLAERVNGARVLDIALRTPHLVRSDATKFAHHIVGRSIVDVLRRAKVLFFALDDGTFIQAHLKMTGKFLLVDRVPSASEKHDHAFFQLEKNGEKFGLIWSDIRRFGYLKHILADEQAAVDQALGPEPLDVSVSTLVDRLKLPSERTIKAVLLDQSVIAGVGNIYADEACFRAGIHPARRVTSLRQEERKRLAQAIQDVLQASLDQRGTSANNYVDTNGERGGFLALLQVYQRAGKPCVRCETPIQKMRLAGRGTHFCAQCQPKRTPRQRSGNRVA